ncbi:MAG TPA: hypothetical protein VH083_00760 [Myxococcales bacterium]|nr:hypothetical protein [Myxococcales bacterium]
MTARLPQGGIAVHFASSTGQAADAETDEQGNAAAVLTAPRIGWGSLNVTASASMSGQQLTGQTAVKLIPGGGLASSLSFSCAKQNVGALVSGRLETIHVQCGAVARDAANREIADASIQTLAEAGSLAFVDGGLVYAVAPGDSPPADVDPVGGACRCDLSRLYDSSACPGEPCWTDAAGLIHNPRDGVATLIAAVPAGPDAPDLGEPFVDSNDNGVHDPGEPYLDYNGNGQYDAASGKLGDHLLWSAVRIIWSGDADVSSAAHSSFIQVDGRGAQLFLHDANFNALAADGPSGGDLVSFVGSCDQGALTGVPSQLRMPQVADGYPGIAFKSDGTIAAPASHETYLGATDAYAFSFGYDGSGADACTLTASIDRSYDPGAPGFAPSASLQGESLQASFTP